MKKIIFVVLILSSIIILPSSCKKGEDDPLISLRSRKARLVGEWKCSSFIGKYNSISSFYNYSSNLNFSGNTMTITDMDPFSSPTTLRYSLNLVFEKDGRFSAIETIDTELNYLEGTWNFLGKIGDDKNKESIVIKLINSTNSIDESLFALNGATITYRIKELRNKKIVLLADSYIYIDGTDMDLVEGDYVFESK